MGSQLPCDKTNMAFFRASTTITIDDGNKASFWHANCIGDGALSGRCPLVFTIATHKNKMVHCEVRDDNWIRSVASLNAPDKLREFVALASIITTTILDPERPDSIAWQWCKSGQWGCLVGALCTVYCA